MVGDSRHVIRTGRNGTLDGTTPEEVAEIIKHAQTQSEVVIHLHGGLVDEKRGLATAQRLTQAYLEAGAYPIFMVWRSGLLEVLKHNLDEIAREELFKRLLRRVLQFSVGKLRQDEGQRAAGNLSVPDEIRTNAELGRRTDGEEPFDTVHPSVGLSPVTEKEEQQLQRTVERDPEIREALEQVLAGRHPETEVRGARGGVVRREASASSLIDPAVLDEIDPGQRAGGERGILSATLLAKKVVAVLVRVIGRFRSHTDHGVYPTVVEELLRELYLANAGGAIWKAMKGDTVDTFAVGHGGRALLDGLASAANSGPHPRITLVGHSTGAVYIDNLLGEVVKGKTDGYRPWRDDMRFRVVLLAPADTYTNFTTTLKSAVGLIDVLRVFTMTDEAERADRLVGAVYPRSLLYFVSGVLERNDQDISAVIPLVGMARYLGPSYDDMTALARARTYLTENRVVLSPTGATDPPGRRASATTHAAFDDDPMVLASIAAMIAEPI